MRLGWMTGVLMTGAALVTGCSMITDSSVNPSGIGAACSSNDDCHASTCDNGICVSKCSADLDCPTGTQCVKGLCHAPLKVRGAWVGLVSTGEGWTLTHDEGMRAAQEELGYVNFAARENLSGPPLEQAIDEFAAEGAQVIIANSFDHRAQVYAKAPQYPDIKFLICSGIPSEPNIGSYFGRLEQAWYVAGKVAAQKAAKSKRLGFIGSYIAPEVVRHANAFLRGAQSVEPSIKMEVRWTGFWYDPSPTPLYTYEPQTYKSPERKLFAEEYATAKLIDTGCEVIAHQLDNQRVSKFVEMLKQEGKLVSLDNEQPLNVWTLANDNQFGWKDSQGNAYSTALGAPYWNWRSMYIRLLEQVHRHTWKPVDIMDPLSEDHVNSTVGFELNPAVGIDDTQVRAYLNESARSGHEIVFQGPFDTTGQRPSFAPGELLGAEEWRSMCWFIKGAVEKTDPSNPLSADVDARVPDQNYQPANPALDPAKGDQITTAPEIILTLPFLPDRGMGWKCNENQL